MRYITIRGEEIDLVATALTFSVGIAGGLVAWAIGAPLPMLLGSVTFVGALSILGFKPGGKPPKIPM